MPNSVQEYRKGGYSITTDSTKVDINVVHGFLSQCYWAKGIPKDIVKRSVDNSLCFSLFDGDKQIGLARVILDYATYAYIGDVFILETHRGRGLSKWLMSCIMSHPDLQGLRRWSLLTRDAHELYQKFGFTQPGNLERYMEILHKDIYR